MKHLAASKYREFSTRMAEIFKDREYYRLLWRIALPITFQQLIMSSLNMVSVMIIGQLGEVTIAAVGLANQIGFLFNLLLFGITSGSAIFTAQFWGKRDLPSIHKVLGICLILGLAAALLFLCIAQFFPAQALRIYSKDEAVIALGSRYLRVFGWSFLFFAVSYSYGAILRSIGDVRTPMVIGLVTLSLNILLSYLLIFGYIGLPKMGIMGAATATIIARIIECAGLLIIVYKQKGPSAAPLAEMMRFDGAFFKRMMGKVIPVALNELLWSLGIAMYYVVYARIGTDAIAAMNIAETFGNMSFVMIIGIGNACAILVGNLIGAMENEKAFRYAGRSMVISVLAAVVVGCVILVSAPYILEVYKVSPSVRADTLRIVNILAVVLWIRATNYLLFIGIFRSGGDTRFGFLLDVGAIWLVGVPMALLGAFVLHLPVYLVYLMIISDEVSKFGIGLWRYATRRWIHDVTSIAEASKI
jgi:putative MATE family efflux protein